jgi:hypothetical protein
MRVHTSEWWDHGDVKKIVYNIVRILSLASKPSSVEFIIRIMEGHVKCGPICETTHIVKQGPRTNVAILLRVCLE